MLQQESMVASASATPRFGVWDPCEDPGLQPNDWTSFHGLKGETSIQKFLCLKGRDHPFRLDGTEDCLEDLVKFFLSEPLKPAACPLLRQQVSGIRVLGRRVFHQVLFADSTVKGLRRSNSILNEASRIFALVYSGSQ